MNYHDLFDMIKETAQKTNTASSGQNSMNQRNQLSGSSITYHEPYNGSYILKTNSPITIFMISYTNSEVKQGYINTTASAYDFLYADTYDFNTPHVHENIEFFYVLSGHIDVHVNDGLYRYSEGMAGIINQNVMHLEHYSVDSITVYITLTNDYIRSLCDGFSKKQKRTLQTFLMKNLTKNNILDYLDFVPIKGGVYPELQETLIQLIQEMLLKKEGFQLISKGLVQRIFSYLQLGSMFYCSETTLDLIYSNKIYKAIVAYIQERRYYITRNELAVALNYNEDYLNWIFQNETGQNLGTYIRNVYLEEASHLLLTTDLSISKIIEKLHLSNRTSFYNQFHKKYGTTPAQYREHNQM